MLRIRTVEIPRFIKDGQYLANIIAIYQQACKTVNFEVPKEYVLDSPLSCDNTHPC